jgi:hypothetical protein
MNYHAVHNQHPAEVYRPKVSHIKHQERIARAALQHVPGALQVLNRVYTKEYTQPFKMSNPPQNLKFYTGFDKQH